VSFKLRLMVVVMAAAITSCGSGLNAALDDHGGNVRDWAVDRLAAFGIDEEAVLASDQPLPRWVWTNPDTGAAVIAYEAPSCRQYPQVGVTETAGRLEVTIDPVTDPNDDCGSSAGWGLALFLERPWTAADLVPAMAP
jgi:hypothetical protein